MGENTVIVNYPDHHGVGSEGLYVVDSNRGCARRGIHHAALRVVISVRKSRRPGQGDDS